LCSISVWHQIALDKPLKAQGALHFKTKLPKNQGVTQGGGGKKKGKEGGERKEDKKERREGARKGGEVGGRKPVLDNDRC